MTTKVVPAPEIWIVHYKQRETVWHYKPSSLAPDCEAHRYVLAAPAVEGERRMTTKVAPREFWLSWNDGAYAAVAREDFARQIAGDEGTVHRYVLAAPAVEGERQEPVAWMYVFDDGGNRDPELTLKRWKVAGPKWIETPLYASPVEPSAPPAEIEIGLHTASPATDNEIQYSGYTRQKTTYAQEQPAQDDAEAQLRHMRAHAHEYTPQAIEDAADTGLARLAALRDQVAELCSANSSFATAAICEGDGKPMSCPRAPCESCVHWLQSRVRDQQGEIERLRAAIEWALGERGEFQERPASRGRYWWRTELRERAAIAAAKPQGET